MKKFALSLMLCVMSFISFGGCKSNISIPPVIIGGVIDLVTPTAINLALQKVGNKQQAVDAANLTISIVDNSVIPYLDGNTGDVSANVVQSIIESKFNNLNPLVKWGITTAASILDSKIPKPDVNTKLTPEQVGYIKSFFKGVSSGCKMYLNQKALTKSAVEKANNLKPGNWFNFKSEPVKLTTLTDDEIYNQILANTNFNSKDRAVIFGNNYTGTGAQLFMCEADAKKDAINLVKIDGFKTNEIHVLLGKNCTKANYEKYFTWCFNEGKGGRRAAFNSSHGAEYVGTDGKVWNVVVTNDMIEKGVWDETTVIPPVYWSQMFRNISGDSWMFLNDSCHSGGQVRFGEHSSYKTRSIVGNPEMQQKIRAAVSSGQIGKTDVKITGGTIFNACRAGETANESQQGGVATICYWKARVTLAGDLRVASIIKESNRLLREDGNTQAMNPVGSVGVLWSSRKAE